MLFQPPAFPKETPETIKEYIREKYLLPQLDPDEFTPEKVGRQWEFDWFERAKILPDPSLPRSIIVPTWEVPFRRQRDRLDNGGWEPKSEEVYGICIFIFQLFKCSCFNKSLSLLISISFPY